MTFCRHCGEDIEIESRSAGRAIWVHVNSGDQGGTYDYCNSSRDELHHPHIRNQDRSNA